MKGKSTSGNMKGKVQVGIWGGGKYKWEYGGGEVQVGICRKKYKWEYEGEKYKWEYEGESTSGNMEGKSTSGNMKEKVHVGI